MASGKASGKAGVAFGGVRGAAALMAACVMSVVPAVMAQPAPTDPPKKESTLRSTTPVPPSVAGKQNAALLYFQLQDVIPREVATELQNRYAELTAGGVIGDDSRKSLAEHKAFFQKLMDATKVTECDWGIQYQDGFGALLPHLGTLRKYARLLAFDARRCLAEKDLKGAAERYAAIYRMSIHASRGKFLICSLVGEAIQALGCISVQERLDAGELDVETARVILNAAKGIVGEDAHLYVESIAMEEYMAVDWVKEHYTGPDAGERLLTDLSGFNDEEVPGEDVVSKMDGATLSREVEKTRAYYQGVRAAWHEADAAERLKALSADVEAGKFGKVTLAIGAFDKAHRSMLKGKEQLATTVKNLELFVRGEYVKPSDKAADKVGEAKDGAKPVGAK
jgi:hypothetical protein